MEPDDVLALARKLYEASYVPHYLDFDDLPAFQWRAWVRLAQHKVHK